MSRGDTILRANGDELVLDVQGMASAVISVQGSFVGEMIVLGANSLYSAEGPRSLWVSGSGSIGTNVIRGSGIPQREFRCTCGSERIIIRAQNWESGEATVSIIATDDPSLVSINGPVHMSLEEAQRAGRAYSVGTSTQPVTAMSYMQIRFENPSGSGKRMFLTHRLFSNSVQSGQSNLELGLLPTYATPLVGATVVEPNNLLPSSPSSDAVFEWVVSETSLGVVPLSQILPVDGVPYATEITRIVDPGQSFAYQIGGDGGSLNNAARVAAVFIWFEEDL